jgi:acyl carrier protein
MNDREVLNAIETVAREHVGFAGELSPELRLVEDLELDSLKALTLAVEVENHFRVSLEPEVEAEIATVGDLVAAIRRLLARDDD